MTLRQKYYEYVKQCDNSQIVAELYPKWLEARDKKHLDKIESRDRAIKAWKKEELQYIEMEKEHLAKIEKMEKTILHQATKIADLVKYIEGNEECKTGVTAKPCHCEDAKNELKKIESMPTYHVVNSQIPELNGKTVRIVDIKDGER